MDGANNYVGPGLYRHYEGNHYMVMGLGIHEHAVKNAPNFDPHDPEQCYVVYMPIYQGGILDGTPPDYWIRSLVNFNDFVASAQHGHLVRRFEKIDG